MSSIKWVFVDKGNSNLLDNKVKVGEEKQGTSVFVSRAKYPLGSDHQRGVYPGKLSANIKEHGGAAIGVNNLEIEITDPKQYQILTAGKDTYKWVSLSGPFQLKSLNGVIPFQAGYEISGDGQAFGYDLVTYYIVRGKIVIEGEDEGVACGKVYENSRAKIPFGGKEHNINEYEVLVYA